MNTPKTLRVRGLTILIVLSIAVASLLAASSATAVGVPGKPSLSVVATCIKAVWTAVSGADSYKVQYSTSKSFTASTTTTVKTDDPEIFANNLVGGTTYYFRVAAVDGTTTSAWGSATSAKAVHTHPAPTGVAVDNANGTSIELSWIGTPSTWAYKIRARSSGNPDVWTDASGTYATVTGLKKATKYSIRVYAARSEIDGWPTIILGPGSKTLTTTTSSYDLAAPQNLHVTKQKATSVGLAWDAVTGLKTGWKYQIQRALNTAMTRGMVWSAPVSTNSMTLSGLAQNTPYFVRLRVVDDKGAQRSDRTLYVMAKSVVARGTIQGVVNGVPSSDVVVGAYDSSNELASQSAIDGNGNYTLKVRPGAYRVRANYVGTAGFASTWARSGATGAGEASSATKLSVTTDQTTTAPAITVAKGAEVSGVVKDPSGNPVADVDVSVLTASTSQRELVTSTVTGSGGDYKVKGLPDGKYWLRMLYSADGFKVRSIAITLKSGKVISVRVSTSATPVTTTVDDPFLAVNARLDLASWYRRYGVRVEGSKHVGNTQTAVAPPWVAGTYPASYGSRTLQWKRNGAPISGATKTTYKLRSADRGKKITVTATFRKYGYVTGSTTSRTYRIG